MTTLAERLERIAEEHSRTYVQLRSFGSKFDGSLADYCAYLESEAKDPNRSDVERTVIRKLLEQWRAIEGAIGQWYQ